jgi:hypothetical protein
MINGSGLANRRGQDCCPRRTTEKPQHNRRRAASAGYALKQGKHSIPFSDHAVEIRSWGDGVSSGPTFGLEIPWFRARSDASPLQIQSDCEATREPRNASDKTQIISRACSLWAAPDTNRVQPLGMALRKRSDFNEISGSSKTIGRSLQSRKQLCLHLPD